MSLELTKEDCIEAQARGWERVFSRPEVMEMLAGHVVSGIAQMFELLSPAEAAALIGKAEITLERNRKKWGLTKSVWLGREGAFYFMSEILARAKSKVEKGNENNVVPMPTPGVAPASKGRKAG